MFNKLVIIEHINMLDDDIKNLNCYAKEVIYYNDLPESDDEIINRIADADAILLSYTSKINSYILEKTTKLKYIGMCCSLYSKESANVDIAYAEAHSITVKGIRDYGDEGVGEYIIYELVGFLQGYQNGLKWDNIPHELSSLKCGVIGLGTSGRLIADTLQFFKCDVSYYSRTRKYEAEDKGIKYLELNTLVSQCDAIFLALNKNTFLLNTEQFALMNGKRILFNTSIGPGHDVEELKKWLEDPHHFFFCDTQGASGISDIQKYPNIKCVNRSAGGASLEAFKRLGVKVIDNIIDYQKSCL